MDYKKLLETLNKKGYNPVMNKRKTAIKIAKVVVIHLYNGGAEVEKFTGSIYYTFGLRQSIKDIVSDLRQVNN